MIKITACVLAVATLTAAPAIAQTLEALPLKEGRPCAYRDVVGLWDSQVIKAGEKGVEAHYAALPRDYMRFKADGGMMYYGTNRAVADAAAANKRLDELDRTDGVTYLAEVPSAGVLLLRQDGVPFQGFTCTMTGERAGKAVMVWTQLKGYPELRRIQIRMD